MKSEIVQSINPRVVEKEYCLAGVGSLKCGGTVELMTEPPF